MNPVVEPCPPNCPCQYHTYEEQLKIGEVCPKLADPVNRPSHYLQGTMEVIEAIEGMALDDDFYLATAVKYIARCRHKGNQIQDIKKAIWYLNRKIARLQKEAAKKQL